MDNNTQYQDQPTAAATPTAATARNPYAVPTAIILGFAMISAAIFFSGGGSSSPVATTGTNQNQERNEATPTGTVAPVTEDDHIRGNANAPIVIVDVSDYDCPFCKNFHDTMNQIIENYGPSGDVAWVYRHFPIAQLHPSAPRIAAASECVANLAGNDAFWTFSDLVFNERGINEPTNMSRLTEFAVTAGAPEAQFEACLASGETEAEVAADYQDAVNAGAEGTPYSIVMVGDQQGVINGAQPYSSVSQVIENLLGQIRGNADAGAQ